MYVHKPRDKVFSSAVDKLVCNAWNFFCDTLDFGVADENIKSLKAARNRVINLAAVEKSLYFNRLLS